MARVDINSNIAAVTLPPSVVIVLTVTTNSPFLQKVRFANAAGKDVYLFEGKGERNLIGSLNIENAEPYQIHFTFSENTSGEWKPSQLRVGGPYSIGSSNFLIIVAENGDDSDFNDVVLQFSWKTK